MNVVELLVLMSKAQKTDCERCAKAEWCPARRIPGIVRCDLYVPGAI